MLEPLITTFITTYQRPKLLRRALTSVLSQTYPYFQVLVSDNASGDETAAVVREFAQTEGRVKYHCHPKNIGMIGNYEFCLSKVETPLFSFLSDDDFLLPCFYETMIKDIERFPDAGFYAASVLIKSPRGRTVRVPIDAWSRAGVFAPQEALKELVRNFPVPVCVLFHKRVVDQISIDRDNPLVWDCDYLLHVAIRFPVVVSKQRCGIFQQHPMSFSNSQNLAAWKVAWKRLYDRVDSNQDLTPHIKKDIMDRIAHDAKQISLGFSLEYFYNKRFEEAYAAALLYRSDYGSSLKLDVFILMIKCCLHTPQVVKLFFVYFKSKSFFKNNVIWMIRKKREREK